VKDPFPKDLALWFAVILGIVGVALCYAAVKPLFSGRLEQVSSCCSSCCPFLALPYWPLLSMSQVGALSKPAFDALSVL
jgi:hypothetical protein